jgi:hypothetical protein
MLGFFTRIIVPPYQRRKQASKQVAVVIPFSNRPELLAEEEISMRHALHFLKEHDKYVIVPPGSAVTREGCKTLSFPAKFFGSAAAHNQLLMWPKFYQAFEEYEYILIYHLDSLVLSDDVAKWCRAGVDYIGAPWIPCPDTPWVREARVGNGGFTLMKVESVLKVLHNRHRQEPNTYWIDLIIRNRSRLKPLFWLLERMGSVFPHSKVVNALLNQVRVSQKPDIHGCNNDFFWSFRAKRYLPEFRIAEVEEGLQFAFEAAPRHCFELNHGRLPFGCHAWTKFDRSFWEPYLLREDSFTQPLTAAESC